METDTTSPSLNIQQVPTSGVTPAGFWIRVVAALLDGAILTVAGVFLNMLTTMIFKLVGFPEFAITVLNFLINTVVTGYYYGYFYSTRGSSLGKLALGLRVQNVTTGKNLTFMQGAIRDALGKLVSGLVLGIGYFMVAFRADKRALHDLMIDSCVVRIPKNNA